MRPQLLVPLREEPRLAHAGLPRDPHYLPPATYHLRQDRLQGGQLVRAPNEWTPRPQFRLGPGDVLRAEPHDLVGAQGGWLSRNRHGRDRLETDVPPDQAGCGLTAQQHTGHRALLQRLDCQDEVPDNGGWRLAIPDSSHDH